MKKLTTTYSFLLLLCMLLAAFIGGCEGNRNNERTDRDTVNEERETRPPADPTDAIDQREPAEQSEHGMIATGYIEFMSDMLYERVPFSYREKKAALWIMNELIAMGYDRDDIEMQEFHYSDVANWLWADLEDMLWMMYGGEVDIREYSQNVVLTVPGQSEQTIIVGAHYDTVLYPGASDNASGTALLLESAYRMLGQDHYHTIVYVFFGAEEIGLLGAYYYYESLTERQRDNIALMINADVLLEGEYLVYGAGYMPRGQLSSNDTSRQVSEIAQEVRDTHGIEIATFQDAIGMPSDQLVFLHNGHTVVFLVGVDLQPEDGFWGMRLAIYGDYVMTGRVFHSEDDCFHFINENWPGKIERAMWTFSILLEEMLLARY